MLLCFCFFQCFGCFFFFFLGGVGWHERSFKKCSLRRCIICWCLLVTNLYVFLKTNLREILDVWICMKTNNTKQQTCDRSLAVDFHTDMGLIINDLPRFSTSCTLFNPLFGQPYASWLPPNDIFHPFIVKTAHNVRCSLGWWKTLRPLTRLGTRWHWVTPKKSQLGISGKKDW